MSEKAWSALDECQGCRKAEATTLVTIGGGLALLCCDACATILRDRHRKLTEMCEKECGEVHKGGRIHDHG